MHVIPNTTVAIYRGTAVDEYSGEITTETAAVTGLQASIIEQTRQVFDPSSGTPRLIRNVTGRVPDGTSIRNTDRLLDEDKNVYYWVRSVRQHSNPIYTSELILDLVRVDPTDP